MHQVQHCVWPACREAKLYDVCSWGLICELFPSKEDPPLALMVQGPSRNACHGLWV